MAIVASVVATTSTGCGVILGIDALDAGPADSAAPADAPGAHDSTVTDSSAPVDSPAAGDTNTTTSDADATAQDGGLSSGDSGEVPDTYVARDGSFTTATLAPSTIVAVGSVQAATGNAQQVHLAVAEHDERAWYFYIDDDTTTIKARVSSDFVHWSDGASLSLGGGINSGIGSDFSVANFTQGSVDVVHLVVSEVTPGYTPVGVAHLRAVITGTPGAGQLSLTDLTTEFSGGAPCRVDGPSTVVTADHYVFDANGVAHNYSNTECDMNIFASSAADNAGAGAWNATFQQTGYYIVVPGLTQAHQLITLSAPGQLAGAFANGNADPYTQVSFAKTVAGSAYVWPDGSAYDLFPPGAGADGGGEAHDDWALCRLSDTDLHAIRHVCNSGGAVNSFEHTAFDGTNWTPAPVPAPLESPFDSGLVLVSDAAATAIVAFAIGSDRTTLNAARWDPSMKTWSGWRSFPGTTAKSALAGSGCGSVHPMIFWTEAGTNQTIVGADVSGFF
jgi:hypothetical protein